MASKGVTRRFIKRGPRILPPRHLRRTPGRNYPRERPGSRGPPKCVRRGPLLKPQRGDTLPIEASFPALQSKGGMAPGGERGNPEFRAPNPSRVYRGPSRSPAPGGNSGQGGETADRSLPFQPSSPTERGKEEGLGEHRPRSGTPTAPLWQSRPQACIEGRVHGRTVHGTLKINLSFRGVRTPNLSWSMSPCKEESNPRL